MTATLDTPNQVGSSRCDDRTAQRAVPTLVWTQHPLIDRIEGGRYRQLTDDEFAALADEVGPDAALAYFEDREARIRKADQDPLVHGFELPHWPDIRRLVQTKLLTGVLGANNSAKSWFMGKLACEALTGRLTWPGMYPGSVRVLMVAQDDGASLQYQQTAVYSHLPEAARKYNLSSGKKRGAITKINYSQANGFTEGTFVLPNKSQCWFKTVAQYTRDPNSFEGPSYHLILIDEGAPLTLLELLLVRAAKVGGHVLYSHTCVHGIDATSANLLTGAKFVKTLPMNWDFFAERGCVEVQPQHGAETADPGRAAAGSTNTAALQGAPNPDLEFPELKPDEVHVKGCAPGHFPYIMQPLDFNRGLIFTWCHWNPFQPKGNWRGGKFPAIFDTCIGQPKWKVRVKLFGWIEKLAGARIGNFDPNVHVIPHEKIAALLAEKKLTTYCMADPHIARSYFIAWKGVDRDGIEYVFDECPNQDEGEWVDANGDEGEGSRVYASVGVNFYKKLIRSREREHRVEATRRFGDPRAFATQAAAADGGTSLFELFARDGSEVGSSRCDDRTAQRAVPTTEADDLRPMYFEPARIRQTVDLDLERIVSLLAFDRERYEAEGTLTVENQPKLYISDRCANIIRALLNYDGTPETEQFKDPIDAGARYGFCEDTPFIDDAVSNVRGGGGWG